MFTVPLKRPTTAKGGELQCVTKERSKGPVTVNLLGITKRSVVHSSSSTEPPILGSGGINKKMNYDVCV